MALTLPLNPDGQVSRDVEPKVRKFQTANFQQRSRVGFNNTMAVIEVSWTPKWKDYWKKLEDFFDDHGGVDYFLWTRPGEAAPKRFVATKWGTGYANGSSDTAVILTATFEEVLE